jgi:hypothetical protein
VDTFTIDTNLDAAFWYNASSTKDQPNEEALSSFPSGHPTFSIFNFLSLDTESLVVHNAQVVRAKLSAPFLS